MLTKQFRKCAKKITHITICTQYFTCNNLYKTMHYSEQTIHKIIQTHTTKHCTHIFFFISTLNISLNTTLHNILYSQNSAQDCAQDTVYTIFHMQYRIHSCEHIPMYTLFYITPCIHTNTLYTSQHTHCTLDIKP